ncbi:hypothetical protein [Brevundimonas vancanneytii]|uniref:hypothetical protein n=1 Tax=Brevundimonas vancanneytii TaxID=1325724 RepID=UPI00209450FD|nr:hypothetical protein [Brevundimonas vancanneytii]
MATKTSVRGRRRASLAADRAVEVRHAQQQALLFFRRTSGGQIDQLVKAGQRQGLATRGGRERLD